MKIVFKSLIALPTLAAATLAIAACLPTKKGSDMPTVKTPADAIAIFPSTVAQIDQWAQEAMDNATRSLNKIININAQDRTFDNTARALDQTEEAFGLKANSLEVMTYVHPDKQMRDKAKQAVIKLQEFGIDKFSNNVKLYQAFKDYAQGNALTEDLNDEEQYFIKESMKGFKRAGLDLPEDKRAQLADLKKRVAKLVLDFDSNINTDKSSITATHEELAGLESDFINALEKTDEGTYRLYCDYPTNSNVMKHCSVEKTRKNFYRAFVNRAYPNNIALLEKIIALRDQQAKILGYESYTQYGMEEQMAHSQERVQKFIDNLLKKAHEKTEKEFRLWLSDMPNTVSLTEDGKVKPWDLAYITEQYKQKHFNLDDREVAKYFPMEKTVDELLDIYQQFFSLTFKQLPAPGAWYEDVKLIEVHGESDNTLYGYLLLDLYPRPNKYSHAAHASVMHGTIDKQGNTVRPGVSVVLANFPKSTETKPSLLKHSDVTTFFHEFGHAMHSLLGRTQLASFSGTSVKSDFVEMPSQMLEKWMDQPEILNKVSSHYKTAKPLPKQMIKTINDLKTFASGNFVTRQSLLSQAALDFYGIGAQKDTTKIFHNLHRQLIPHVALDPEFHHHASWVHLTNPGYESRYYGYLWAHVLAADLFEQIKKQGLLNQEIGKKYKDMILAKGGSVEPDKLLRDFLGREPNEDAFMRQMGLS